MRRFPLIKHNIFSLYQTCESQLLLNQRSQHCGSMDTLLHHLKARQESLCSQNRWTLPVKKNQTVTYMSKFLHAVLHGSGNHSYFLQFPMSVWDDGAAGRRPTRWSETDRGEDARLTAAGGGDFPPLDTRMVGPLYRAGWRALKVRRGLPPLTHYTPSTSPSVRTNWSVLKANLLYKFLFLFCKVGLTD